jgi:uncharacterized membrane protein
MEFTLHCSFSSFNFNFFFKFCITYSKKPKLIVVICTTVVFVLVFGCSKTSEKTLNLNTLYELANKRDIIGQPMSQNLGIRRPL